MIKKMNKVWKFANSAALDDIDDDYQSDDDEWYNLSLIKATFIKLKVLFTYLLSLFI